MSSFRMRAFTLIELLVVIIILAVMSAIVVPAYSRYLEKARFDSEIRHIQDVFAFARERAVARDTNVTLHFDRGSDTFSAAVDPPPLESDQPSVFQSAANGDALAGLGQDPPAIYPMGENYRVENFSVMGNAANGGSGSQPASQADIHFRGDGTTDGAVLDIISKEGYTAHLILWPATGRLTLEESAGQHP
jgi:prepilin-type N-terminal cleavage/methylation domain-containing protein